MTTPKLLKKTKDNPDFITEITRAFNILSKREKLFMISLEGIPTPHIQDLNFQLTNKFFNTIHRNIKNTKEFINYLFIIEYGGIISKEKVFDHFIDNLGIHTHCIVDTSLSRTDLEYYINTCFKKIPHYDIQNISRSDTKEDLLNYLLKQNKNNLLTSNSYNYKIVV